MHRHSFIMLGLLLSVCFTISYVTSTSSHKDLIPPPASMIANSTECKDLSTFCPVAKSQGYCSSSIKAVNEFITHYCKFSCGLCPVQKKPKCVDKSPYCTYGKTQGQCKSENIHVLNYMRSNCQQTCGLCKDECTDKVSKRICQHYKKLGRCNIIHFRNQMNALCKETCGLCDLSKTYSCGKSIIKNTVSRGSVIAGEKTRKGHWPWQVAIFVNGEIKCGGTLVDERHVITAAHCILSKDVNDYQVVLGDHNLDAVENTEQRVGVTKIMVHPSYIPKVNNDIAVLELSRNAILTNFIIPACLPKDDKVSAGTKCYITGWGRMFISGEMTSTLQKAPMTILETSECKRRKDSQRRFYPDTMICARNPTNLFSSGCHGDSGGPLVCENSDGRMVLQGVVSWGSPICDALDRATVFVKVGAFLPWLKNIL